MSIWAVKWHKGGSGSQSVWPRREAYLCLLSPPFLSEDTLLRISRFSKNMEHRSYKGHLFLCLFSCVVIFCCFPGAGAYENYTVGGTLGWYDKLQKPQVNYQKWVVGKNFSLGDFLIFNTDMNHSVIQTYNVTTYRKCDYDNADNDDTIQWSAGEPTVTTDPATVAVPLLKEGMTYFFSGVYDGEQCKHGQHFKINVTHGEGLPNSLKEPTPDSPGPASPDDDNATPDTPVSSNFDRPVESGEDNDVKSGAGLLLPWFVGLGGGRLYGVLELVGLVWLLI